MTGEKQVYVIEHPEGYQKLGRSVDPEGRLSAIQGHSPYELSLRTTTDAVNGDGRVTVESYLHSYYSPYKVTGEWFELPDRELDALDQLDVLNGEHIRRVQYDIHGSSRRDDGKTLRDYLHGVWAMDYDPDDVEGDR